MDKRNGDRSGWTLGAGKILVGRGERAIDCTVVNFFGEGAFLQVRRPIRIPKTVALKNDQDDLIRLCTGIWKTKRTFGVSFR